MVISSRFELTYWKDITSSWVVFLGKDKDISRSCGKYYMSKLLFSCFFMLHWLAFAINLSIAGEYSQDFTVDVDFL
jgi:hypothetical protein